MRVNRKYTSGDTVKYHGKKWIICKGGRSNPKTKSFEYKVMRGAWIAHVAGNCLTTFNG